jgi:hypothetical protein
VAVFGTRIVSFTFQNLVDVGLMLNNSGGERELGREKLKLGLGKRKENGLEGRREIE